MASITDITNTFAASIYIKPCTEEELIDRFKDRYSPYGISRMLHYLESNAIYFKGDVMHIKKSWAKENLKDFELDFRSDREKELDGMTDFAKQLKKKGFI